MMHTHAKARCYADGGLVQQLRRGMSRLMGNSHDAQKQRGRDADAIAADKPAEPKAEPATPSYDGGGAKTQDNPAGIKFAKGGKVPGKSPTPTADNIPIMATAGEFVIKKAAVDKIGVQALEALNAIADGGGKTAQAAQKLRRPAGKPRFADGGEVAPYVNHRRPKGPPAMPPPLQIGNSAPGPGTAVTEAPYRPNFTMGTPQQPPAAAPAVTDVRAKFNPDTASKEARAFLNERVKAAAAPQAAAAPAAAPAAQPASAGPSVLRRSATTLTNAAGAARQAVNSKAGAAGVGGAGVVAALNAFDTPTEAYERRFAMQPYQGDSNVGQLARDVGVRALGAASDLGNAIGFGIPGLAYADKVNPLPQAATAPRIPLPNATPATAVAAAPAPATAAPATAGAVVEPVVPTNVTRVGNSYSGPANIAGDIAINGAQPRGGFVAGTGDGTFTAGGGTGQSATDAALFEARRAAIARGDVDSVRASYGGDFGAKVDPLVALMNNGRPMTTKKANAAAQLQRNAMDGAKTTAETDKAKLEGEATRQLLKAQTKLTTAKDAKTKLKAMEDLRALQGKYEKEFPNRFTVVPGGDEIGPDGFTVIKRPARVLDNQTSQFVDQAATAKPAAGAITREQYNKLDKGDRYTGTDGKTYTKG